MGDVFFRLSGWPFDGVGHMTWDIVEKIIVGLMIASAAIYMGIRTYRSVFVNEDGCNSCSGCPSSSACQEMTNSKTEKIHV